MLTFWYHFKNMYCSTFCLIQAYVISLVTDISFIFWPINSTKKRPPLYRWLKPNLDKKLWSHFYNILTFYYQSRHQIKNIDSSTSSWIFDIFDFSTIKTTLKKEHFYTNYSNLIWTKVMSSVSPNTNILISF